MCLISEVRRCTPKALDAHTTLCQGCPGPKIVYQPLTVRNQDATTCVNKRKRRMRVHTPEHVWRMRMFTPGPTGRQHTKTSVNKRIRRMRIWGNLGGTTWQLWLQFAGKSETQDARGFNWHTTYCMSNCHELTLVDTLCVQ